MQFLRAVLKFRSSHHRCQLSRSSLKHRTLRVGGSVAPSLKVGECGREYVMAEAWNQAIEC